MAATDKLDGVIEITPDIHFDDRGYHVEIFNDKSYKNLLNCNFVQDNFSLSKRNVLRGIHGDDITSKLVYCVYGEVYAVIVDCNKDSKTFGDWKSFVLSDKNRVQLYIPPKFGNSYLVLSDEALVFYKQSSYYGDSRQFTYKWNDDRFNISWPISKPILSERDSS